MSFILSRAVVVGLSTSQVPPFQDTPPITMADLLHAINFVTCKYSKPSTSGWLWT